MKTLGAMKHKALYFLKEFAQHIYLTNEDNQAHRHHIQRLSVAIQRGTKPQLLGALGWIWSHDFRFISIYVGGVWGNSCGLFLKFLKIKFCSLLIFFILYLL